MRFCTICGAPSPDDYQFCPCCGTPLRPASVPDLPSVPNVPPPPARGTATATRRGRVRPMVIAVAVTAVVALAAAAIAAALLWTGSGSGGAPSEPPEPEPDARDMMLSRYYSLAETAIDIYGNPEAYDLAGPDGDATVHTGTGVPLVMTEDLDGDGREELLMVHGILKDSYDYDGPYGDYGGIPLDQVDWTLEVWAADEDGEVAMADSRAIVADPSRGGFLGIELLRSEDGSVIAVTSPEGDGVSTVCLQYAGDGSMDTVETFGSAEAGYAVERDRFASSFDSYDAYLLADVGDDPEPDMDGDVHSVDDVIGTTMDTCMDLMRYEGLAEPIL